MQSCSIPPARPRAESLTGARFIAAAAVLAFHIVSIGHVPSLVQRITTFGRCGVCFFFVLSGFVMTLSYRDTFRTLKKNSYFGFVLARFARIAPMHVAALLLITPLCLFLNRRGDLLAQSSFVVPTGLAARSWVANLFLVHIYNPRIEFEQMYNAPAWSVACEAVFYLLFPFLILLLQRLNLSVRKLTLLAFLIWIAEIVAVFAAIGLLSNHTGKLDERTFDFAIGRCPLIRIGEFAVGCCAGLIFLQQSAGESNARIRPNRWLLISLGVLAVSFAGLGALPHFKFTHWCLAITPASAIAIIALATDGHALQAFLQSRIMLLLGESSYALYLLQWTAILFFRQPVFGSLSLLTLLLIMIGCVAVSIAAHLLFEKPVCRGLRRTLISALSPSQTTDHPATSAPVAGTPLSVAR